MVQIGTITIEIPGNGPSNLIIGTFGNTKLPSKMEVRVTLLESISLRKL